MSIKFSLHAKRQLKRRRISQKMATQAINESREIASSFRDRKLRRIRVESKLLEVVTKTEGSKITVITAYYVKEKI